MSAKSVYETTGKSLLYKYMNDKNLVRSDMVVVDDIDELNRIAAENAWLLKRVSILLLAN